MDPRFHSGAEKSSFSFLAADYWFCQLRQAEYISCTLLDNFATNRSFTSRLKLPSLTWLFDKLIWLQRSQSKYVVLQQWSTHRCRQCCYLTSCFISVVSQVLTDIGVIIVRRLSLVHFIFAVVRAVELTGNGTSAGESFVPWVCPSGTVSSSRPGAGLKRELAVCLPRRRHRPKDQSL